MSAAVHSDIACSRLLRIRSQTARRPERGMNDAQTSQNLTMHWPCWQEKQSSAANSALTNWQQVDSLAQCQLLMPLPRSLYGRIDHQQCSYRW